MTHGSRINRACFTQVTGSGSTGSGWRICTVCDNKSVNLFDFTGKQVQIAFFSVLSFMFLLGEYDLITYIVFDKLSALLCYSFYSL
jgi:hypothetical protein